MPTIPMQLIKGDQVGSETDYRDALPVNMYAVNRPILGTSGYMVQYSGLTLFASASGICRGMVWNERTQRQYGVFGNDFVEIASDSTITVLGIVSGSNTVSLPYSFNTQAIIAGGDYYLYDEVNGFREVTDPDVGNPIDGVWVDGYYFFCDAENIFHTNIADEETVDPLSFSTSAFSPDPTLAVERTQDNKVAVFNRYTTEFFQNVATENFAFQRLQQRAINAGIVGTHAKAVFGPTFFILGGSKEDQVSAYSMSVGGTSKISTREVDKVIGKYSESELATSIVEAYQEDGIIFVIYHLPSDTLLFNATIAQSQGTGQAWTILQTANENNYRGIHYINNAFLGRWLCADKTDGSIAILDEKVATQYDAPVQWKLFTPFYYAETGSIDQLEIETIPGFNGGQEASVFVSRTTNGFTYGQEWTELYAGGYEYHKRFIVRRLGYVSDWVGFQFRGYSDVRMSFAKGTLEIG